MFSPSRSQNTSIWGPVHDHFASNSKSSHGRSVCNQYGSNKQHEKITETVDEVLLFLCCGLS
jgi:hypothetical protein